MFLTRRRWPQRLAGCFVNNSTKPYWFIKVKLFLEDAQAIVVAALSLNLGVYSYLVSGLFDAISVRFVAAIVEHGGAWSVSFRRS